LSRERDNIRFSSPPKTENNHPTTSTAIVQYNPEVADPPSAVSGGISTSKEQISKL